MGGKSAKVKVYHSLEDLVGGVRAGVLEVGVVGGEVGEVLVAVGALVAAAALVALHVVLQLHVAHHLAADRALGARRGAVVQPASGGRGALQILRLAKGRLAQSLCCCPRRIRSWVRFSTGVNICVNSGYLLRVSYETLL